MALFLRGLHLHHHHHLELVSDTAVSTSVCQAVLFCWACRWAVARRRLSGHRSFSIVRNQVCLGRPGLLLQCLGRPVVLAYSARLPENDHEWSQLCRCDQRREGVCSRLHQTVMVVGFLIGQHCWWYALSGVYSGRGIDTIDQEHQMFSQPMLSQPKSPHHTERLAECRSYRGTICYRRKCGSTKSKSTSGTWSANLIFQLGGYRAYRWSGAIIQSPVIETLRLIPTALSPVQWIREPR